MDRTGIIILGHGSKLKEANRKIPEVIKAIKKKTLLNLIKPAYLQFQEPNLTRSIKDLVDKNCKKIIIVPFFLFNGNHVIRDIPNAIKKESERFPKVNFVYTKNICEDEAIGEILIKRINEASS